MVCCVADCPLQGGYHGTHLVLDQLRRLSGETKCESVLLPATAEEAAQMLRPGDLIFLETPLNPDTQLVCVHTMCWLCMHLVCSQV